MKKLRQKLKPASGLSGVAHVMFIAMQPIIILLLVQLGFGAFAAAVVLLAKWRMFAVRPRYWLSNIRANLVDIFVGLSVVVFMVGTAHIVTQIAWASLYTIWLLFLKPRSDSLSVTAQALIAQAATMVAFYRAFPDASIAGIVVATWLVCYASARHFLNAFEEPHSRPVVHMWAWFGASLAWVLAHWSIEYLFIPQLALLLTVIGYGLATTYYLYKTHRLHDNIRVQLISIMMILVTIIIFFSDWKDKTL